ncbi:MAG: hypothetical protein AB7P17_00295 [Nitrospirales bacterium]|nr:hypothetical protein [Nitrospirales bacterium]
MTSISITKLTVIVTLIGSVVLGSIAGIFLTSTRLTMAEVSSVKSNRPIFTSGINIVNADGQVRATLGLWDEEHPALILGDAQCDRRASFAVFGKERTGITLYGQDCKRRAALEVEADDVPSFVLRDHSDTPRAQIRLNHDGSPLIRLFDANGRAVWEQP